MNKKRVPIFFQQFRFTVDTVGEMARKVVASGKSWKDPKKLWLAQPPPVTQETLLAIYKKFTWMQEVNRSQYSFHDSPTAATIYTFIDNYQRYTCRLFFLTRHFFISHRHLFTFWFVFCPLSSQSADIIFLFFFTFRKQVCSFFLSISGWVPRTTRPLTLGWTKERWTKPSLSFSLLQNQ